VYCYELFGVLDFICNETTYKISVLGHATTFVPKKVFQSLSTSNGYERDDHYGHSDKHEHGDRHKSHKTHKRNVSQVNRSTVTSAMGTTQATCTSGPQCGAVAGGGKRNLNNGLMNDAANNVVFPDNVIYVSGNPNEACAFVPLT